MQTPSLNMEQKESYVSNLYFGALWSTPCFEFCAGLQVTANNIILQWFTFKGSMALWKTLEI